MSVEQKLKVYRRVKQKKIKKLVVVENFFVVSKTIMNRF